MKNKALRELLAGFPDDADVEVCLRDNPDYGADYDITGVSGVVGTPPGEPEITINTNRSEFRCDHA